MPATESSPQAPSERLVAPEDSAAYHPDFLAALAAGTAERYYDADLYDLEYGRRRHDVAWYRELVARQAQGSADPESFRIVELGCGSGRLLLPLARAGHHVLGVDRSSAMLQACRKRLSSLNARTRARVHILQSDFRQLPLAGRFPLILCPFNAFMHLYTRADIESALAEVRRLLTPDGMFALDVFHPDPVWLARNPTRRFARTRLRHPRTGERLIYTTSHVYDPETQLAWIRFFYEPDEGRSPLKAPDQPAQVRVVQLAQRLFFPAELEALLHYNGFAITYRAGGFDDSPLSPVSSEQVICARLR